jgi:hypothetical protein
MTDARLWHPWLRVDGKGRAESRLNRVELEAVPRRSRVLIHPLPNPGVIVTDLSKAEVGGVLLDEPTRNFNANGSAFGELAALSGEHDSVVPGDQIARVVYESIRTHLSKAPRSKWLAGV